jgi:bifunctional non-homologous end joining protein LigD
VIVWDKGTYRLLEGGLTQEKLVFELKGRKLKGRFALAKMKGRDDWLLIKARDSYAIDDWRTQSALRDSVRKRLKVRVPPCETH